MTTRPPTHGKSLAIGVIIMSIVRAVLGIEQVIFRDLECLILLQSAPGKECRIEGRWTNNCNQPDVQTVRTLFNGVEGYRHETPSDCSERRETLRHLRRLSPMTSQEISPEPTKSPSSQSVILSISLFGDPGLKPLSLPSQFPP
jgi:hypothetical protein